MKNGEEQDLKKKELILQTTLDLIVREGFEGVTIRKIASEANVNVALIHYYYGSKNKLINEVIQTLVQSLRQSFFILDEESIDPRERLKRFLIQYVNVYHEYPFIVTKLLANEDMTFESKTEFVNFMKAIGLKKVQHTISQITGETDPQRLTIMMSHLIGSTFLPVLIEPLYEQVTGLPLPDMETRVDIMLERYFS